MQGVGGIPPRQLTDTQRAMFGFFLGLLCMFAATRVFLVNSFDFDNMARGVRLILSGINPWAPGAQIPDFYNPPHSVLFLWPMLLLRPPAVLSIGCASLFAFLFYHRAWVGLAWFATNTVLWLIAAGGVDMLVVGAGLILLLAGDTAFPARRGLVFRVIAYGLLMVKPQGGFFIVLLYILSRRDWKAALLSAAVYGLPFLPLYPGWISAILHNPPLAQTEATHTLAARYGMVVAGVIALGAVVARKWRYWELGGALAGILAPYGMPGIPTLLTLTAVRNLRAIPIVVVWSALLAVATWVSPPAGVDYYDYLQPFMAIYHLGMFGLALALACIAEDSEGDKLIAVGEWLRRHLPRMRRSIR